MLKNPATEDDTPDALKVDILTLVRVAVYQAQEIGRLKTVIRELSDGQDHGE